MTAQLVLAAAIDWDPTVRGLLIVVTALAVLPGSVFLVLSTNLGARMGFLVALTGFMGWMTIQGLVWTVYAQGNKGALPHWEVKEIVTGDIRASTFEEVQQFPATWNKLPEGNPILGDAQAAADHVLIPPDPNAAAAHGGATGEHEEPAFEPPFKSNTDYVAVGGYNRGGETYFLTFKHKPHWAVIQVRPAVTSTTVPGQAPVKPKPDPSKPVTSVVMLRDLGNVRLPPFLLMVSSFLTFCVLVSALHRRDKQIMAERAAAAAGS